MESLINLTPQCTKFSGKHIPKHFISDNSFSLHPKCDKAGWPKYAQDASDQEIKVSNIKFISKLNIFSSCQVRKKRLNDVHSGHTLKCQNFGTRQRSSDVNTEASVKLCVLNNDKELWLQAFTEQLKQLFVDSGFPLQHLQTILKTFSCRSRIFN